MYRQPAFAFLLALVACVASACGSSSPTAPTTVNAAGLWTAAVQVMGVSGGECVGPTLSPNIGTKQLYTIQITQNASELTAVALNTATGIQTTFSGTAGTNSITLNATSTSVPSFSMTCANGARRDVYVAAAALSATVSGSSGSGTLGETDNVFVAGTQVPVGAMTFNASLTMTR